jgi:hypothetical protein
MPAQGPAAPNGIEPVPHPAFAQILGRLRRSPAEDGHAR